MSSPQLPGWIDFLRCFWSLWLPGALNWSESTLSCVTPNPFYCSGPCCCSCGSQESLSQTKNCCLQSLSGSLVSILSPMFSPRHLPVRPETNQGTRRKLIQRTLINMCAHSTHWKNIPTLFLPRCSFEKSQSNQHTNLVDEERVF